MTDIRWQVIETVIAGLGEHPDLQDVPIEAGFRMTEPQEYIAVGPEISGTRSIPVMSAGRKRLDDEWPLRIWTLVHSDRRDGLTYVAQRFHTLSGAVVDWVQDNVSTLGVDGNVSIGGAMTDGLIGPVVADDGTRAVGWVDIPIHNRLT